jgi:hypothetical protein
MARHTRAKKHTHKYYRRPDKLWACAGIDGCTHFMPSNMIPAPENHKSICWKCDEEFILTSIQMLADYPKCDDCSGVKEREAIIERELQARLEAAGIVKREDPYAAFRQKKQIELEEDKPESEES